MAIKRILIVLSLIALLYGMYLNAFSVIHGDLFFFNDVARDFLLLRELDQKKIVLIGPRTNNNGLFHGPLWTYINYPAYVIGHGNPVVVAWYWIILLSCFLVSGFIITKKLVSTIPAIAFVLLMVVRLPGTMNGLFHSLTPFLFIPAFFLFIHEYIRTKKVYYLVLHLIALSIITQLNIGIGGAMCILSVFLSFSFILIKKLWKHIFAFIVIPICLSNFIIFDIRHNFMMYKTVLTIIHASKLLVPFDFWIRNRIENTVSLQLLQNGSINPYHILEIILFMLLIFTVIRVKKRQHRLFYFLVTYFYFGYMTLSFINKGVILGHFVFLLIPFTVLWLSSFLEKKYVWIFLPIILIVFSLNLNTSRQYVNYLNVAFIGSNPYSWVSLSAVAKKVITNENGHEFGYYVFSPDSYAYQPRYAMIYHFERTHAKAFEYVKKPVTYVIAAPPPPDDPYMNEIWWIKNQVHILSEPVNIEQFPSGYKIEKFLLTPEEQKVPHDKNIELGLTFR